MTDRLLKENEFKALIPYFCTEKGEVYFERPNGERLFIPRLTFIHLFQRFSEIVAGMAAKR